MQIPSLAQLGCLSSAVPNTPWPSKVQPKSLWPTPVKLGLAHLVLVQSFFLLLYLSSLSVLCRLCMCNAASDSLIVRMLIQFPVIMWHIHFRFLLILLVTFDENSHQWGEWLNYILSDGFEIVFSLCFRFGNNWLVLYSSSSNWQFGICLQNLCFGAGNNKFGIPLCYS